MSDRKTRATSLMGFLFMPQLRLSFQHFSHIIPVFMRTVALMFEQGGLIHPNHPATMYGVEGVKKYSFFALMGEAWHTLRTTRATPAQWAMFSAIILMIGMILSSAVTAVMTIGFGFGAAAQAQIFGLPGKVTDANTIPPIGGTSCPTAGLAPPIPCGVAAGPPLFDRVVPAPAAGDGHSDYGIMILDKMLRQGMMGTGGKLQNSMRDMIATFNQGVLVVAGIMLFWCLISVVIDTAKTGRIGGGRHNMVWAPIRIVFALAMLIPLGPVGFSSGQFIVSKIAEFGSNLGTNTWFSYVNAVTTWDNIIPSNRVQEMTELTQQYTNMWVCRLTFNAETWVAIRPAGSGAGTVIPRGLEVGFRFVNSLPQGSFGYAFTNDSNGNLCGMVTMPDNDLAGGAISQSYAIANAATSSAAMQAQAAYKVAMDNVYVSMFFNGDSENTGGIINPDTRDWSGLFGRSARTWACDFVQQHIWAFNAADLGGAPLNPLTDGAVEDVVGNPVRICESADMGLCGGSTDPATPGLAPLPYPGVGCMSAMVSALATNLQNTANAATQNLRTVMGAALVQDAQDRGWANMGMWFLRLQQANITSREAVMASPITITPGALLKSSMGSNNALNGGTAISGIDKKMLEVQNKYNDWWATVPLATLNAVRRVNTNAPATVVEADPMNLQLSTLTTTAEGFLNPGGENAGIVDKLGSAMRKYMKDFATDIAYPDDPDIYPFAALIVIGYKMVKTGIAIIGVSIFLPMALGWAAAGLPGGSAVASLPIIIGSVMIAVTKVIASTFIISGSLLTWWLPLMPWVRVTFSVLGWAASVFEAVVLVPIAALAFITTEGEGMAPGSTRATWGTWLGILFRPALTVIGYVGAIMIFNTFVAYLFDMYSSDAAGLMGSRGQGFQGLVDYTISTVVFVGMVYTIANSSFKMIDHVPNGFFQYIQGYGVDKMGGDHEAIKGLVAGQVLNRALGGLGGVGGDPTAQAWKTYHAFAGKGSGPSGSGVGVPTK